MKKTTSLLLTLIACALVTASAQTTHTLSATMNVISGNTNTSGTDVAPYDNYFALEGWTNNVSMNLGSPTLLTTNVQTAYLVVKFGDIAALRVSTNDITVGTLTAEFSGYVNENQPYSCSTNVPIKLSLPSGWASVPADAPIGFSCAATPELDWTGGTAKANVIISDFQYWYMTPSLLDLAVGGQAPLGVPNINDVLKNPPNLREIIKVIWLVTLPNSQMSFFTNAALGSAWGFVGNVVAPASGGVGYTNPCSSDITFARLVLTNNGYAGPSNGTNYGTNIFGWARFTIPPGKTAFTFPFDCKDRTVANLCRDFPSGSAIVSTLTGNSGYSTNWRTGGNWDQPSAELVRGRGYFALNTTGTNFVANFAGTVSNQSTARSWTGAGNYYIFVAPTIPRAGYLADLGFDNDESESVSVHLWNGSAWEQSEWVDGDGWTSLASFSVDAVKGPWIGVGQPFMLERHGSDVPSWTEAGEP